MNRAALDGILISINYCKDYTNWFNINYIINLTLIITEGIAIFTLNALPVRHCVKYWTSIIALRLKSLEVRTSIGPWYPTRRPKLGEVCDVPTVTSRYLAGQGPSSYFELHPTSFSQYDVVLH